MYRSIRPMLTHSIVQGDEIYAKNEHPQIGDWNASVRGETTEDHMECLKRKPSVS